MFRIIPFTSAHIDAAQQIARRNYQSERMAVPDLLADVALPDLSCFADNGLGIAAFSGDQMIGFLCAVPPFPNAFQSTDTVGVFSPLGANGTVVEHRGGIAGRMYQAAAEKWVAAGASSHAISLYAHDLESQNLFFRYGFGLRCADAIRGMEAIDCPLRIDCQLTEMQPDEFSRLLPLDHLLDDHMAASPTFIRRESATEAGFIQAAIQRQSHFFAAQADDRIVAFLRIERCGETFVSESPAYLHINGAYCLPEFRGKGIFPNLLNFAIARLKAVPVTRLGVDYETINPAADRFWSRHFHPYCYTVVRRIDEHALPVESGRMI